MHVESPLKTVARSVADDQGPEPSALPLLIDLLFADTSMPFWHAMRRPMKSLLSEELAARQWDELAAPLATIGGLLRDTEDVEDPALSSRILNALDILEAHRPLFFLPDATTEERLGRLPLFAPMAVLHLAILGHLHTLAYSSSIPAAAYLRYLCNSTALTYGDYARQSVADALAWRTDQLKITCTPMRSAIPGGPNLQVTCVDSHTGRTIVDEMCTAYPGVINTLLQRTVDQVSLYEEQLHWKIVLFWEHEVLDVLSEWTEEKPEEKRPAPNDMISERLDDALFLIMQDIGNAMTGQK
ncbi:hypothetical protein [Desulfoluna spongiiphila]|uniref:Uncharacterized protein n=1 Tax=Desulfoluna spongiiphila TaxID=419481 RepID=A0A1G5HA40_9BACT|nr:hypothetical protein [Desulfoluna spongiiphila]SCY60745.1 hypothetical protein SAMN05216233_11352 [Desulfoluna spongiiphila]